MCQQVILLVFPVGISARDPTVFPAWEVLRMATTEGAQAVGLGDEVGSLEAGKQADLTLLEPVGIPSSLWPIRCTGLRFFSYGYRLLEPTEAVCGIALASLIGIGLMKLDALVGRGSRKDFYDVYALAQQIPLPDLLARAESKYPYARDFALMAVESIVLFDNADRDLQPDLLIETPWPEIRQFFVTQAQALGKSWFEQ
jgi:hypothetical protein